MPNLSETTPLADSLMSMAEHRKAEAQMWSDLDCGGAVSQEYDSEAKILESASAELQSLSTKCSTMNDGVCEAIAHLQALTPELSAHAHILNSVNNVLLRLMEIACIL